MNELFNDIEPELSPRLKWMRRHGIVVTRNREDDHLAYKAGTRFSFTHKDEVDALVGLAKKLNIRVWNEE